MRFAQRCKRYFNVRQEPVQRPMLLTDYYHITSWLPRPYVRRVTSFLGRSEIGIPRPRMAALERQIPLVRVRIPIMRFRHDLREVLR